MKQFCQIQIAKPRPYKFDYQILEPFSIVKFNAQKDQLFLLIKSLSKAEKRNFKLYTKRAQSGAETKFFQLFEAMDKLQDYDENALLKKLTGIEKKHLANLKRHLYKQILISLRLIYIQKNIDIQIREQLDFARILYTKGMYMQSLRILDRIKKIATEHNQDLLHLEIIEFQKLIEARHITRSRLVENKMEALLQESAKRSTITLANSRLSNLNIIIHGYYIQYGVVKNKEDRKAVEKYFRDNFPQDIRNTQLTFFEKVNLYQSYMWYYYILLDFKKAREYASQWVNLFQVSPQMQTKDPDLYMRGLYYLLTFIYFEKDTRDFEYYLQRFNNFEALENPDLNANSQSICFVYLTLSKLNYHLLQKQFKQGLQLAPEILEKIELYKAHIDIHRILLFYYKIAYLHFCCGDFEKALEYLNEIIHQKGGALRNDLHFNSRLLHLLAHYELKNFDLLGYQVPALQRALNKANDCSQIQAATLLFIKRAIKAPEAEAETILLDLKKELEGITQNQFEYKAMRYLDIPTWVESKLQQHTIQEYSIA